MSNQMSNIVIQCCLTFLCIQTVVCSCVNLNPTSKCYSNHFSTAVRFFGTKTTYSVAKQTLDSRVPFNSYKIPDCEPIMFYLIGRHAIRYPDAEDITEMSRVMTQLQKQVISSAERGLTQLCEHDLQSIRNWKLKMNESDDNRISGTGVRETKAIAKDFKFRFPSLFDTNRAHIEVGITPKERTEQTADAFIEEIQLKQNSESVESTEDDSSGSSDSEEDYKQIEKNKKKEILKTEKEFLYFHKTCKELLSEQGVKLGKPKVVLQLRESNLMQSLIERVNQRLGFNDSYLIDALVLKQIVRTCYFEYALHNQLSGWCSLLGDEELKILEYLDDIEDFHEDAYGRDINGKQTCPLIGDLFTKVKKSVKTPKELKTYLHFTHAGVMKRLYSGLGLFNHLSDDIDSKNDESICLNDSRKWKSSLICPFSANFAAVLYQCSKTNENTKSDDKKYGKYKLLTLVQEKPVVLNGCDDYFCSVDKFIDSYRRMASDCDLKEICRI